VLLLTDIIDCVRFNYTQSRLLTSLQLTLLRTLILWSLSSSDVVRSIIAASYKQNRHEDDLNQALSVQSWGSDRYKRRYFLIEGLDDTNFRIYRESNPAGLERTWWSVAGDIDELRVLAEKLAKDDGGQKARTLSSKMLQAVPRFEATEEVRNFLSTFHILPLRCFTPITIMLTTIQKRKRREYRQIRKQQFQRPEPGFSNYEGRTRGKRMKYTYSDEEDEAYSDATSYTRRSTRNTGTHTPAEPSGPTVTQSGRHVRSRQGGAYGESMLSGAVASAGAFDGAGDEADEDDDVVGARPRRAAAVNHGPNGRGSKGGHHIEGYNSVDEMDDEDDASEQDYGDDEEDGEVSLESDVEDPDLSDEDEEMEDNVLDKDHEKRSLVVKLPMKTPTPEKPSAINTVLAPEKSLVDFGDSIPSAEPLLGTDPRPSTPPLAKPTDAVLVPTPAIDIQFNNVKHTEISEPMGMASQAEAIKGPFTPLSPSLAYRGSPEKSHIFARGIDVTQNGQ
jgi:hypothetical protein